MYIYEVSIPVRVLGVLEQFVACRDESDRRVSIPVRVLGVLERDIADETVCLSCFNPCKGFGGFGTSSPPINSPLSRVSIPVRVLGVLEPVLPMGDRLKCLVSIPVRVLGVLEQL